MSPTRTTSSHSTTPSASTAIGSSTRSIRSATGDLSSFALVLLMLVPDRSPLVRGVGGAGQSFRDVTAVADVIGGSAEAFVARIGRVDRKLGEDAARPPRHHDYALGKIDGLEHTMADEDDGLAQRTPEREQVVVEAKAGDLVERGKRLVHQQELRLGHERARDRGAHLHSPRELARIALREAGKADARERGVDARLRRWLKPCKLQR